MRCSKRCAKPVWPAFSFAGPVWYQMFTPTIGSWWSSWRMTSSPFGRVYFSNSSLTWGGFTVSLAAARVSLAAARVGLVAARAVPTATNAEHVSTRAARTKKHPARPPGLGAACFMGLFLLIGWPRARGEYRYGTTGNRPQMFRQDASQVKASRGALAGPHGVCSGPATGGSQGPAHGGPQPHLARERALRIASVGACESRIGPRDRRIRRQRQYRARRDPRAPRQLGLPEVHGRGLSDGLVRRRWSQSGARAALSSWGEAGDSQASCG